MDAPHPARFGEKISTAFFLTSIGGCLDAYTYIEHGGIFASTQTGNLILSALALTQFNYGHFLERILPVIAFSIGILLANWIHHNLDKNKLNYWKVYILAIEIAVCTIVGFLKYNVPQLMITTLMSLTTALQLSTFNTMSGLGYSNMFSTGNLQKTMNNLFLYLETKKHEFKTKLLYYGGLVLSFLCGAFEASILSLFFHTKTIWVVGLELIVILVFQIRCILIYRHENQL
ncbi:DUF1275 domain-containing protein [Apilactobacillus sp. HBW1]|uniref:DUF1275 domain-containing protein n=1 Tax=Apilactobacillus waqarii TaxID=2851006 RepID=A0ABS6M5E4_9LACO|nr:DUF1275 domain-containing protein [Apilactobacillus waqarii]